MARTTLRHTIVLQSANLNGVVRKEAIADHALCPGELVRFDAAEELELHATANGVCVGTLVVLETITPDTIGHPLQAAIDMEYDADDLCYYAEGQPGDVFNMFLANGETAVKGVSLLESDGNGHLTVVAAGTLINSLVGVADADLVNATGAPARLAVRII